MKKINLKTNQFAVSQNKGGVGFLLLGVFMLAVSLGVYGWYYYTNNSVKKEINVLNNNIKEKERQINKLNIQEPYNLEKRLLSLDKEMSEYIDINSDLNQIVSVTFPETMFESMELTNDKNLSSYKIALVVPDLWSLVKQFKAFKSLNNVSDLNFSGITFVENGVSAMFEFDFKNDLIIESK